MALSTRQFAHYINILQGGDPENEDILMRSGKLSAGLNATTTFKGRVVHLDSDGNFALGCTGYQMGMFLMANGDDPDVLGIGVALTDIAKIALPRGDISALVASGGFEIETTEFDGTKTYAFNDPLKSNSDGILTNAAVGTTDAVVGVTSRGVANNTYGTSVIGLYTVYCPGRT